VNPGSKFRTKLEQGKEKKNPHCDDTPTVTATSATTKKKEKPNKPNKQQSKRDENPTFLLRIPSLLPSFL
jgi:hypothetical protein